MVNWKTTLCGALAAVSAWCNVIIAALDGISSTVPDYATAVAVTITAIGLLAAKDASTK
jgi:hypothetical protein